MERSRLETRFGSVVFKNPVIAASTDMPCTWNHFHTLVESGIGGIILKSVTDSDSLQQKKIARFHVADMQYQKVAGQIPDCFTFYSRGGAMITMDTWLSGIDEQLAYARAHKTVLIGSISASQVKNFVSYAKIMAQKGVDMIELNFGNPHGEASEGKLGYLIGQSPELCREIVREIKKEVDIPLIVKLTPQVTDMLEVLKGLQQEDVTLVTLMHRFQGLLIDLETFEPVLGGYAATGGPWMKPLTLAVIAKAYRAAKLEICGGNGINGWQDVAECIAAGAKTVQIGSALMLRGPSFIENILQELELYLNRKGFSSLEELRGISADKIVTYKELNQIAERKACFNQDVCEACRDKQCFATCYFGALAREKEVFKHEDERCVGCGMCQTVCPLPGGVCMEEKPL